jgi:phosphoglycerate dehydrogenase-like enzyme
MKILVTFDLPQNLIERIRNVSSDTEIAQRRDKKEALHLAADADVLFAGFFSDELFAAAKKLKWIQAWGAGVDDFLTPELVTSHVILTNARGVHPTPISEHVLAFMLCFSRKLHVFLRNQEVKKWERFGGTSRGQVEELSGKMLGLIGLGKIGTEIAKKAKCLGMKVIATRRNPSLGTTAYVDRLYDQSDLNNLLASSDFVVLCLPLTKETERLIDEEQLRSMKQTGYLINVSRGRIIHEEALVKAIENAWIAGAGLDTFETEPLTKDSELWNFENVIITPHVGGQTPFYMERLTNIFCENLNRFINNQPLINVVDKNRGY